MTDALVPTKTALDQLRNADQRWTAAVRGLDSHPDRLRTFADAAEHEGRAILLTSLANVRFHPRHGARHLKRPFETRPQSIRPGPPALWKRFDRAFADIGTTLETDDLRAIGNAYINLGMIARQIADALHHDS